MRAPVAKSVIAATAFVVFGSGQVVAASDPEPPRGAAVTVLKATRSCFAANVEVFGIVLPRSEIAVRPERPGLKITDVLVEAGETVTAGQTLAKLATPEGGISNVNAPVAGLVSNSSAVMGAPGSAKGEALFSIIARSEFDLIGTVPARDLSRLKVNQTVRVKVLGAGDMDGRVQRVASTVEPNSQLGQVTISIASTRRLLANSSGRATINTGESCGVTVPLTAILYSSAGTVLQVVRRQRIETRRVEVGLMSGGQVEIKEGLAEGDEIVTRAGALLREGDAVRPISASAEPK